MKLSKKDEVSQSEESLKVLIQWFYLLLFHTQRTPSTSINGSLSKLRSFACIVEVIFEVAVIVIVMVILVLILN